MSTIRKAEPYGPIDPVFKTKWVAALRSGEYEQAVGRLKWANSEGQLRYCCLGVAADLLHPDKWEVEESLHRAVTNKNTYYILPDNLSSEGRLLQNARVQIGLTLPAHDELTHLNDREGRTFDQIAGWIEENL